MNAIPDADDFELTLELPKLQGLDMRGDFLRAEVSYLHNRIAEIKRQEKAERARLAQERADERRRHAETMKELGEDEADYRRRVKLAIAEAEAVIASDMAALKPISLALAE